MATPKVFVSSTCFDLKEVRDSISRFIKSFGFESECEFGVYEVLPLMNIEDRSLNRPWETQRYEQSAKENLKLGFSVDDDFILTVPNKKVSITNKYIVGDRTYSQGADQRRMFDALRKSGKFPEEKCEYLIEKYSQGKIKVLNDKKDRKPEEELVMDVLQIMNVFVAKMNGRRKYNKNIY